MRKQDLVDGLNVMLDMQNPISVWQCLQIRKYELEELVDKVRDLHRRAYGSDPESRPGNGSDRLHDTTYLPAKPNAPSRMRPYGAPHH